MCGGELQVSAVDDPLKGCGGEAPRYPCALVPFLELCVSERRSPAHFTFKMCSGRILSPEATSEEAEGPDGGRELGSVSITTTS